MAFEVLFSLYLLVGLLSRSLFLAFTLFFSLQGKSLSSFRNYLFFTWQLEFRGFILVDLLSYMKAQSDSLAFPFSSTPKVFLFCARGRCLLVFLYLAVEVWNYTFNLYRDFYDFEFEFSIIHVYLNISC